MIYAPSPTLTETCSSQKAAFNRKVLQPFTLSNGQEIPKDVLIEIPSIGINTDPDVFPNPMKYDPSRFYRLRSQAKGMKATEEAALNQFVSVSEKGLTFGYGRHACPGRFFAAAELKMVIARIIMKYDIALAGGETERYQNIDFSHMVSLLCLYRQSVPLRSMY